MNRLQALTIFACAAVCAASAMAEEHASDGMALLPSPMMAPPAPARITPEDRDGEVDMLTTHEAAPPAVAKAPSPFQHMDAAPTKPSAPMLSTKVPFGRAEYTGPAIPSAPHRTEAVPVVGVDAVESSEAAPPTPVEPEADPVQADPAEPTDLTSPIFVPEEGTLAPRRVVIRALNKVTAQSEILRIKPNEMVTFGQLEITAITCRTSSPTSQTDYAGLLDINEKLPTKDGVKPLFRGWMYASSPSITALEHPVYDVTMVACAMAIPVAKKDDKADAKAPAKKDEKPAKKAKR